VELAPGTGVPTAASPGSLPGRRLPMQASAMATAQVTAAEVSAGALLRRKRLVLAAESWAD